MLINKADPTGATGKPVARPESETNMRIRLRPYHPSWIICYFADQSIYSENHNKRGFVYVSKILEDNPNCEIELVPGFDDICLRCAKRYNSPGSAWGKDSSCISSENPEEIKSVYQSDKQTLAILGLQYGSVIKWMDLVKLLRQKLPKLNDSIIGGPGNQERYMRGLTIAQNHEVSSRMK